MVLPRFNPGIPLYQGAIQTMQALNKLPTLQQRLGSRYRNDAAMPPTGLEAGSGMVDGRAVWARVEGGFQRLRPNVASDMTQDITTSLRWGVDRRLYEGRAGQLIGGITGQYGDASSKISTSNEDGRTHTKGWGLGGTLTWQGNNGFYVDGQAQAMWYENTFRSSTASKKLAEAARLRLCVQRRNGPAHRAERSLVADAASAARGPRSSAASAMSGIPACPCATATARPAGWGSRRTIATAGRRPRPARQHERLCHRQSLPGASERHAHQCGGPGFRVGQRPDLGRHRRGRQLCLGGRQVCALWRGVGQYQPQPLCGQLQPQGQCWHQDAVVIAYTLAVSVVCIASSTFAVDLASKDASPHTIACRWERL